MPNKLLCKEYITGHAVIIKDIDYTVMWSDMKQRCKHSEFDYLIPKCFIPVTPQCIV